MWLSSPGGETEGHRGHLTGSKSQSLSEAGLRLDSSLLFVYAQRPLPSLAQLVQFGLSG